MGKIRWNYQFSEKRRSRYFRQGDLGQINNGIIYNPLTLGGIFPKDAANSNIQNPIGNQFVQQ
ncbi:MAG: hypothetical protein OEM38_00340 [Gammaproteobacteria bacterium]|nr:hypothetical protein [Gammaproteobacteria bacterium]